MTIAEMLGIKQRIEQKQQQGTVVPRPDLVKKNNIPALEDIVKDLDSAVGIADPMTGVVNIPSHVDPRVLKIKQQMDKLFVFINAQPNRESKKELVEFDKEFFFDRAYVEKVMDNYRRLPAYVLRSEDMRRLNEIWKKYKFEVPVEKKEEVKEEVKPPETKPSWLKPVS